MSSFSSNRNENASLLEQNPNYDSIESCANIVRHKSLPQYGSSDKDTDTNDDFAIIKSTEKRFFSFSGESYCNQRHPINAVGTLKPIRELEQHVDQNIKFSRNDLCIIFSLIYGNFWAAACISLQAPFFPKEAELKGATPTQYGLIFSIYDIMILLTSPLFGKLVSRYCPVAISKIGLLICGTSIIAFGFINSAPPGNTFIYLAYAIRIVEGVSASAFMTASYTVMAAKFPNRVATTFSYLESAFGVGLIVGPTLGGALYELGGFTYPFIILGLCLLIGCFVIHIWMPPNDDESSQNLLSNSLSNRDEANSTTFLNDRGIIYDILAIITSLNFLGYNSATLEPHLRQFNLSPFFTGLIFVIAGVMYAFTTPLWGHLCERKYNPKLLILFGSLLSCIGIVFLGPLDFIPLKPSLPLIMFALFLIGFGTSAKMACSFLDALHDSIHRRNYKNSVSTYGLVSAMFFTSSSIGASIGPVMGGYMMETFEYRRSTLFIFVIDILMTIYGLFILCNKPKKQPPSKLQQSSLNPSFS